MFSTVAVRQRVSDELSRILLLWSFILFINQIIKALCELFLCCPNCSNVTNSKVSKYRASGDTTPNNIYAEFSIRRTMHLLITEFCILYRQLENAFDVYIRIVVISKTEFTQS